MLKAVLPHEAELVGCMKEPCGFNMGKINERLAFLSYRNPQKTAFITPTVCPRRSMGVTSVGEMTFSETHH